MLEKVEEVFDNEGEFKEFTAEFIEPTWLFSTLFDDEIEKIKKVNKLVSEVLLALQVAKNIGIEDFSIIRIKNREGLPVYSILTKRILENFKEFFEVAEELVDSDNYYTVELLDLARYDSNTIIELLEEAGEHKLLEEYIDFLETNDEFDED